MTETDQKLAAEILNIFQTRYGQVDVCFLEIEVLRSWLNADQMVLVDRFISGAEDSATRAEKACQPPLLANDYQRQFVRLPKALDKLFGKMSQACHDATGRHLETVSAYRSPAYQAVILLRELYNNSFELSKTIKSVKLPGQSEHQDPLNPALDLGADGQLITDENFMGIIYPWLKTNAQAYGFYETYPEGNSEMIWEPWHWRASSAALAKPAERR